MGWTSLLDENDKEIGVVGDAGWDLASYFIRRFHEIYLINFGRPANRDELDQSINFVFESITDEFTS